MVINNKLNDVLRDKNELLKQKSDSARKTTNEYIDAFNKECERGSNDIDAQNRLSEQAQKWADITIDAEDEYINNLCK